MQPLFLDSSSRCCGIVVIMEAPLLIVQGLTVRLMIEGQSITAVNALSFELHKGKTVALVGESGCGKTLTALAMMRILPEPPFLPVEGELIYRDMNLLTLPEVRMRQIRGARMAMIFQDSANALNPVYPIGDQLMEVARLHLKMEDEEAFALAMQVLEDVGIPQVEECLYSYPHQLSGGMRQRVMIAMALMCEPDILIADEPTTALDVTIQAQVLELIAELQRRRGTALLLITHDMGVVAECADEVIVMYASEGVEQAPVVTLFDATAHPYTRGLFLSRPRDGRRLQPIAGSVPSLDSYPKGCKFHPRCPYRMEKCCHGSVPLFTLGGGHQTHCWLWDGSDESKDKQNV